MDKHKKALPYFGVKEDKEIHLSVFLYKLYINIDLVTFIGDYPKLSELDIQRAKKERKQIYGEDQDIISPMYDLL